MAAAPWGNRGRNGIDGAVLAAGMARIRGPFSTAPHASDPNTRTTGAEAGLSGCATVSRPVALERSRRELYPRFRTTGLEGTNPWPGATDTEDHADPQSCRRITRERRNQTDGGGVGCIWR